MTIRSDGESCANCGYTASAHGKPPGYYKICDSFTRESLDDRLKLLEASAYSAADISAGIKDARAALASLWRAHVEAGNDDLKERAKRALYAVVLAEKALERETDRAARSRRR
jgi:hypothetical protein